MSKAGGIAAPKTLYNTDGMMIHPTRLVGPLMGMMVVLLLTGCAGEQRRDPPKPQLSDAQRALQLVREGKHAAAASLYRQMAATEAPPKRQTLLLQAADHWLLAGQPDDAARLLDGLDTRGWPDLLFKQQLLTAEIHLAANRTTEALALLTHLTPTRLPHDLELRYREDRAAAFRMAGNRLESANELAELDLLLSDPQQRLKNQRTIVSQLAELPDTTLELLQPQPPGILGGWMELARVAKRYGAHPAQLSAAMASWREVFPSHPAVADLFADQAGGAILSRQRQQDRGVAVLLPLSGHYQELGRAVRDGLLAAYFGDSSGWRAQLMFFDTGAEGGAAAAYAAAVEAGAELVLGPLRKESVAELAALPQRPVRLVALNWLPQGQYVDHLFQFGLSPEDEARQVAERAWGDGFTIGVVLTPEGEWGERIFQAFRQRWEQLGGVLPERGLYNPAENDFATPLQALLNLDESLARRQEMQKLLGKRLGFEPRIRGDADFIFLVGHDRLVRQLRPQLQFHHAAQLPVYSTSHVYTGRPDKLADVDLEGVTFPDIPWLLLYEGEEDPLKRERLEERFPQGAARHPRLYAMGADLYEILRHSRDLRQGGTLDIDGRTGILRLDGQNRILRRLVWARFEQGQPKVLGYGDVNLAPEPAARSGGSLSFPRLGG